MTVGVGLGTEGCQVAATIGRQVTGMGVRLTLAVTRSRRVGTMELTWVQASLRDAKNSLRSPFPGLEKAKLDSFGRYASRATQHVGYQN